MAYEDEILAALGSAVEALEAQARESGLTGDTPRVFGRVSPPSPRPSPDDDGGVAQDAVRSRYEPEFYSRIHPHDDDDSGGCDCQPKSLPCDPVKSATLA
jgi:hypothetical protein